MKLYSVGARPAFPRLRGIVFAAVAAVMAGSAHADGVTLLGACPGEDSSTCVRIVWHSESPSCRLSFGQDGSGAMRPAECEKMTAPIEYTGNTNYYRYRAELKGLKPGTKYAYSVSAGGEATPAQSFRTAPENGVFNFLWMGDVHSTPSKPDKIKVVDQLVARAEEATVESGGISFVLFSGDAVKHGQTYSCWTEWDRSSAKRGYMMAMIPGNKEYYRDKGNTRWHDRWFSNARNNPPNGAPGLAGSYWFIYGGVLFVGIDTLAGEGIEMDGKVRESAADRQREWFEQVASSQKGRYRYLVVFQHYPYFKTNRPCSYGKYDFWSDAFLRHGVDFALSGDSHLYVRSRRLKDGKESTGGTVYVVCPSIDARMEEPSLAPGEGLVEMYDTHRCSYGACWFSVTPEKMTLHYICPGDAKDRDTVTVGCRARH